MISLTHIPTLLLLIGYPVFWLELYGWPHPTGNTSLLAPALFVIAVVWLVLCRGPVMNLSIWRGLKGLPWWFLWPALALTGGILAISFGAALLPPHLPQEFDAINYHITIPRQHLITGSFAHLAWSTADLFLLPLDFALAPFWLMTILPNKFPQWIIFVGYLAVSGSLALRLSRGSREAAFAAILASVGLHLSGIQAGTAMMDVVAAYLFLAAIDSWLAGNIWLGMVEFVFFFWSKPLYPSSIVTLLCAFVLVLAVLNALRAADLTLDMAGRIPWRIPSVNKLVLVGVLFCVFSLPVATPFMLKSMAVSGSPFFPLTARTLQAGRCERDMAGSQLPDVQRKACLWARIRNSYGHGRSVSAFIKHFWLLALPESGVNNAYDYPAGLMYLLILGPFVFFTWQMAARRKISVGGIFVVLFWGGWWLGSQQSRFLIIPLSLMSILVVSAYGARLPRKLMACMLLATGMTFLSIVRAHYADIGKDPENVLRVEDRLLLERSAKTARGRALELKGTLAAFATCMVDARDDDNIFVIKK